MKLLIMKIRLTDWPTTDDFSVRGRGQRDVLHVVASGRVAAAPDLRGAVVERVRIARQRLHGTSDKSGRGGVSTARRPSSASTAGFADHGGHDVVLMVAVM